MSFIFEFPEISTYLVEESDHTITACMEVDDETTDKPVKSNIRWGPNKAETLDQLILEKRLDYEFTETYFILTDTALLVKETQLAQRETPMDDEEPEVDLLEMFRSAKGTNCKLTLTGERLTKFEVSKASTDLANLDITHKERMQIIENERSIARAKKEKELNVGLSTIRSENTMQVALNKEKNDREISELTMSVETDVESQRMEVGELKERLQQETHNRQLVSERLRAQTKNELAKLTIDSKAGLETTAEANRALEKIDQQNKAREKHILDLELRRKEEASTRCHDTAITSMKTSEEMRSAAAKRTSKEERQSIVESTRQTTSKLEYSSKARTAAINASREKARIEREAQAREDELFAQSAADEAAAEVGKAQNAYKVDSAKKDKQHSQTIQKANSAHQTASANSKAHHDKNNKVLGFI